MRQMSPVVKMWSMAVIMAVGLHTLFTSVNCRQSSETLGNNVDFSSGAALRNFCDHRPQTFQNIPTQLIAGVWVQGDGNCLLLFSSRSLDAASSNVMYAMVYHVAQYTCWPTYVRQYLLKKKHWNWKCFAREHLRWLSFNEPKPEGEQNTFANR